MAHHILYLVLGIPDIKYKKLIFNTVREVSVSMKIEKRKLERFLLIYVGERTKQCVTE